MGIDLCLRAGGEMLLKRLGREDVAAIDVLREKLPAAVDAVFGNDDLGTVTSLPGATIASAARQLATVLNDGAAAEAATYYLELEDADGRKSTTSAGMQCNIDGAYYSIRVGRGRGEMRKLVRGADGTNVVAETAQVRPPMTFRSEDGVTIRVRQRTDQVRLVAIMSDVAAFCERHGDGKVSRGVG